MKVIPRLDVSCLYKQTGQASAIFPVQSRKFDADDEKKKLRKKKKNLHFMTRPPALGLGRVMRPPPNETACVTSHCFSFLELVLSSPLLRTLLSFLHLLRTGTTHLSYAEPLCMAHAYSFPLENLQLFLFSIAFLKEKLRTRTQQEPLCA